MTGLGHVGNYNFQKPAKQSPFLQYPSVKQREWYSESVKLRTGYEKHYQQFKKLKDSGMSYSEIAINLGLSKGTLNSPRYLARYRKEKGM